MARHDGDIEHSSELGPLASRQEAQMNQNFDKFSEILLLELVVVDLTIIPPSALAPLR